MDVHSILHVLRLVIWVLVFVMAWRYRSLPVGIIAILGATANGVIGLSSEEEIPNVIFMITLPAIAYILIDYAHTHSQNSAKVAKKDKRPAMLSTKDV